MEQVEMVAEAVADAGAKNGSKPKPQEETAIVNAALHLQAILGKKRCARKREAVAAMSTVRATERSASQQVQSAAAAAALATKKKKRKKNHHLPPPRPWRSDPSSTLSVPSAESQCRPNH